MAKCARCGREEATIDGYCSTHCKDAQILENKIEGLYGAINNIGVNLFKQIKTIRE